MDIKDYGNSRKEERSPLLFDPLLLDTEGRVIARVADLSMHGAMLYARCGAFGTGDKISGWLQVPPLDDNMEEIFQAISFRVCWVKGSRQNGWMQLGCELDSMDEASSAKLKRLIVLTGA